MKLESYTKIDKNGKQITKQHYPKLYGRQRKEQKRTEAGERKKAWDKLTLEQKWDAIGPTGSGEASRPTHEGNKSMKI